MGLKVPSGKRAMVLDPYFYSNEAAPGGAGDSGAVPPADFHRENIADRLSDHMGMEARMTFGNAPTVGSLDRLVAPSLLEPAASTYLETSAFTPTGIGMTVQNQ
jgi:hypothetical protein